MDLIITQIKLRIFYAVLKEQLGYDNYQDFCDHVIRLGLLQLQEGIAARNT